MPSSTHVHVSKMIDWITRVQPASVLDIGVGFGKWGFLAREYTDINEHRYKKEDWKARIDGVEAFPEYATPSYEYIYNKVHYGDLRETLPTLDNYDLIIIGDVIEHFPKEVGRDLLRQMRQKSQYVLLSSPTVFFTQEMFGNDFEQHHSLWTVDDFKAYPFEYDEFGQWVFVALIRGELPTTRELPLNGKAAQFVYSKPFLKQHPKVAELAKGIARRFL